MEIIRAIHIFNFLDYMVLSILILITFLFIYIGQKKKKALALNEEESIFDFLIMGRRLTLPLFTATLVATWYGGIFGTAQIAFESGIYNFITQGLFWYITYIIFAIFIVHKISKFDAITLPDLVGKMFGPRSEKLAAIFNILNLIPIAYTISLGLIIQMFLPLSFFSSCLIGIVFVMVYSLVGGFRSVVYSDLFQFIIMTLSVILVLVVAFLSQGIGPILSLPPKYYDFTGGNNILQTLSWGLIALGTLVDPNFYQRCFAAEKPETAKKGILLATMVWIIFDLSLTFGAMYAAAIIPNHPPQSAYFDFAFMILPHGLKGFFLAGILATVLSTLDSYLFLAGSTISFDLFSKKNIKHKKLHIFGILITGIFSLFLAMVFDGNIKHVWKTLGSLSTSALLCPILYGHVKPNLLSDKGFVFSSMSGALGAFLWRYLGLKEKYAIDEIYIGMILSFLAILLQKKRPLK